MPDPTPAPVAGLPWWKSQQAIAYLKSTVLLAVGWALVGATSGVWDWRAGLLVPILSNLLLTLQNMWSKDVVGPLPMMNKRNAVG